MLNLDAIAKAHAKVKSGADFPNFLSTLKQLGVKHYEVFVYNGDTCYTANNGQLLTTGAKYPTLTIATRINRAQFSERLKFHQRGLSDFDTFCNDCANSGISRWVVALDKNTCTYYDNNGIKVLSEDIKA